MMSADQTAIDAALARADQRIAALEARLARLEPTVATPQLDEVASRRGLFKLVGAVATGAVAHTMLSADRAAAADGNNVVIGNNSNSGTNETTLTRSSGSNGAAFKAVHSSSNGSAQADGLRGESTGSSLGAGVVGLAASGIGVLGESSSGYSLYAGGPAARIGTGQHLVTGPPSSASDNYAVGDVFRDASGNMYVCVTAGTGSTGQFRKIAGPGTAGQLHLSTPVRRAYDSRAIYVGNIAAQGGEGLMGSVTRTVDLSRNFPGTTTPLVPAGVTGALVVIGISEIPVNGYLTLYPTGTAAPVVLSAFWGSVANHQLSSLAVVALSSARQFDMKCVLGGSGGVNVSIDVFGYFQ
jgi:hypothetical protein